MIWLILSILVFVVGIILICKRISSKVTKVELDSGEEKNSLKELIDQRRAVLNSLEQASKGYSLPDEIESLKANLEEAMAEEEPIVHKLKAVELELNAIKKAGERAALQESSAKEVERDVKDFHILFEKYFRELTPAACSELKAHANLLESLDVEIVKLEEKLSELVNHNQKLESKL